MINSKLRTHLLRNSNLRNLISRKTLSTLNISGVCKQPETALKMAIIDESRNIQMTYKQLNEASSRLACDMISKVDKSTFSAVGSFNKPGAAFTIAMIAAWKLGKVFVPLSTNHSEKELAYFIEDSKVGLVSCSSKSELNPNIVQNTEVPIFETDVIFKSMTGGRLENENSKIYQSLLNSDENVGGTSDSGALVIYTSGTTGKPKGVLHTHQSLFHMTTALVQSWKYTEQDKILHFLPLYHVHGLVNKLLCMLYVGATVEFMDSAAAPVIWKRLAEEEQRYQRHLSTTPSQDFKSISLFMAVPTIYARMLETANDMRQHPEQELTLSQGVSALKRMRLMVSGSAALPDSVLHSWQRLTGYKLLERYGMTEIGMALSNPYEGDRKEGHVGQPLPGVQCRLVDDAGQTIEAFDSPGELRIKGPNVFQRYLNRPDATKETFDPEGWFKTGDVAELAADGYYKILGRNSSDIIKSAGYKLSALEIERELLAHPEILEAAVVGMPDEILGERVFAVIALRTSSSSSSVNTANTSSLGEVDQTLPTPSVSLVNSQQDPQTILRILRSFLEDRLAQYKQPREYLIVDAIPRNHMGKVNKKTLLEQVKKP